MTDDHLYRRGVGVKEATTHRAKMKKWLRMTPTATQELYSEILSKFVPLFEEAGFQEVVSWFGDPEFKVTGREVRLERWESGTIDSVHIAFDKYTSPWLSISIARRDETAPLRIIRGAMVTKSHRKYYNSWGKPWWLPIRLWPADAPARVVGRLVRIAPQILAFLDRGTRGPNIGRAADGITY